METITAVISKTAGGPAKVSGSGILALDPKGEKATKKEVKRPEKKSHDAGDAREVIQAKIERIAEFMDNYVRSIQRDLKISVHEGTGDIIVKVISAEDGRVIREIAPKELLDLAAKMEEMTGGLFNENA